MNKKLPLDNLINFIDYLDNKEKTDNSIITQAPSDLVKSENLVIENNGNEYYVVGKNTFVPLLQGTSELHLNEIDKDIIQKIKKENELNEFSEHFNLDDPIHICNDNNCPDFDDVMQTRIEVVLEKIKGLNKKVNNSGSKNSVVAFYKPFHYARRLGGIYLIVDRILNWVRNIHNFAKTDVTKYGNYTIEQIYLILKVNIFYHEMYHHKVEAFATKIELLFRDNFYSKGFHCFYCNTYNTDYCFEEAFANVHSYNKTLEYFNNVNGFDKKSLSNILREIVFRNQPPGYRLAFEITEKKQPEIIKLENYFFETVWQYAYTFNYSSILPGIIVDQWNLFTYNTDPLVNTINDITYLKETGSANPVKVRNFV